MDELKEAAARQTDLAVEFEQDGQLVRDIGRVVDAALAPPK